jgi:hypothetical protein
MNRNESGTKVQPGLPRAAAVLVPCTSRKSVRPARDATAVSLESGYQCDVETAWRDRLAGLPLACPAGSLYSGRGMRLGRQAAAAAESAFFIISAGLGLVAADRMIPTYGLTVSGRGAESVVPRIVQRFAPTAWWRSVSAGPFSTDMRSVFAGKSNLPILVALSQTYAKLIIEALDALSDSEVKRLRIVGFSLADKLPERLSRQVLPYDGRLQSLLPGTMMDFAQRALLHFAEGGLHACPVGDVSEHCHWVEATLAGRTAPVRALRTGVPCSPAAEAVSRRAT